MRSTPGVETDNDVFMIWLCDSHVLNCGILANVEEAIQMRRHVEARRYTIRDVVNYTAVLSGGTRA
jgi:hypothetical protein